METLVDKMAIEKRIVEVALDAFDGEDTHIDILVAMVESLDVIGLLDRDAMEHLVVDHPFEREEERLDGRQEKRGALVAPGA